MQKWENRVDPAPIGRERDPNHTIPLTQWSCYGKLARDLQALLGDDAEITAKPVGPSDTAKVHKIGRYMTSRVFDQMGLVNPLCVFAFRRILNGHSIAYRPWERRCFDTKVRGAIKRVCDYEGPGFYPCEPGDIVTPPERGITSIQDFCFVGRRVRVTIDELQRGDGTLYQGTSDREFLEQAVRHARENGRVSDWAFLDNKVQDERERSEGVDYDAHFDGGRSLWIWEWCGYWRPLQKRKRDADIDDLERRLPFEADWCIRYSPGLKKIIGVQDLIDIYPQMRRRRPFVESTLIKDGSYRPKGFGALLEDIEDDATANSRLFSKAGELSVWPVIFYRPSLSGLGSQLPHKLEPGEAIPTDDPSSVNVVKIIPNLEFGIARQQDLLAVAERLTGISDQELGRAVDRPNAPRTATGQIALIEQGNIRAWLDATVLREDMQVFLQDVWELDSSMLPTKDPGLFFRVTEEQAGGLFESRGGGAHMTSKEFGGKYDFSLKFATTVYAKEARKQQFLAFYQVAAASPLVMMNPLAMWNLLNKLAKEFGIEDFDSIVPKPPEPDMPKTPDQEWNQMLEGDYPEVNPQDNDALHIADHSKQIDDERQSPERDEQAIQFGVKHLIAHKEQQRVKMLMQAQVSQLVQSLQEPDGGGPVGAGIQRAIVNHQAMNSPVQPGDKPAVQSPQGSPIQSPLPGPGAPVPSFPPR